MYFSLALAASYNRSSAVNYADNWSNNCNAFEGDTNCSVVRNTNDYHDYTSFFNDCANFISQVLQAGGGLGQISTYWDAAGPDTEDDRNWFWDSGQQAYTDYSHSWTNVVNLRNHAYNYLNWRFVAKPYFSQADPGGFFVFDNSDPFTGNPTHGRVLIGYGNDVETGSYGRLIDSHTAERKHIQYSRFWNPNIQNTWIIHVCDDPGDGNPC
jgi:hypothetical protein